VDAERQFDTTIRYREIFAGISDMSFFGHIPDAADSEVIAANTPAAQFIDRANPKALSYPVVNIGPWGREYHQRLGTGLRSLCLYRAAAVSLRHSRALPEVLAAAISAVSFTWPD
jgi:hypothetical protein